MARKYEGCSSYFSLHGGSPNSILWSTLNNNRIFQDVAGDVTVIINGVSFLLHKFPLVTRSGKIRKMTAKFKDLAKLELHDFPGGPKAFELVAKFCYGMNFTATAENVAHLRCAAEFLEMTEEYHEQNLIARTEAYLDEVVFHSLEKSLEVLLACESLTRGISEEVNIPIRCVEAIARNASKETDWWVEDLSSLSIGFYENVILALVKEGVRTSSVIASLMHYAQVWLKGIGKLQICNPSRLTPNFGVHEHYQKAITETLVKLLPPDKTSPVPLSFVFGLLRMAVTVDASITCRLELERRVGFRLDMVSLDDLLIPSVVHKENSLFDIDTVSRIVANFLQQMDEDDEEYGYESQGFGSPSHGSLLKVGRLVDAYLAEVAPDPYLSVQKFASMIEILPDYARVIDDGLYRALDIYLKAHPMLTEDERKRLCKHIDCQKLSQEACNHAAQNNRLPVQMTVKVLYFEQIRMKNSMSDYSGDGILSQKMSSGIASAAMSPRDTYASLRRENRELKLEISRLRMRLNDLEKEQSCMKQDMIDKSSGNVKTFFRSISILKIFGGTTGNKIQKPIKAKSRRSSIS